MANTKKARNAGCETRQVSFRLPIALEPKILAFLERLRAERPGELLTESDAIRAALARGLESPSQ